MSANYDILNDKQREAVFHTEGPLLILAGAGAGKTRVLTYRIAYLIEEEHVDPWHIMAITFTNKAAQEMKERVQNLVDFGDSIWVTTFHSSCVRILRRYINLLGYDTDFTIYDTDDQKQLLKHVIKELNLDPKMYKERALLSWISSCKNEMLTPEDMKRQAAGDYRGTVNANIYAEYQTRLKANNALDFDDLLLLTVQLFRENEEVLRNYQERFRYIMVDEYQDTNRVQFEFVWLLARAHGNLCVVGDDDQSIYRFRGADIRNILEFENHFPGTHVVKLEQNYRSTSRILNCANAVIRHNRGRKEKHLWSELGEGEEVEFRLYENGYEEAEEVVREIRREVMQGASYEDFAILYRTNAQSRAFEEKCIGLNVPYRMVGGVNFYQRAEIKDILAYLKTVASGKDDIATQRIINVPKRGIGQTTVDKLLIFARQNGISLMEAISRPQNIPGLGRAGEKLQVFAHLIGTLREWMRDNEADFGGMIREIVDRTEYLRTLDDLDEEQRETKLENIDELISKASDFTASWDQDSVPELTDFLEEVALVADVDAMDDHSERLLLMTLHGSKGLEFENVYLCGMEDGLFPSYMSIGSGDPMDIEEERRLCYVGITRAKRRLKLTAAKYRTLHGEIQYNMLSRFIEEIPTELISGRTEKKRSGRTNTGFGSSDVTGGRSFGGFGSGASGPGTDIPFTGTETRTETKKPAADFGKPFKIEKASALDYAEGDRVTHIKFGKGTVMEIIDGKRDYEVRVDFDEAGERRLFASFAKLKKIDE